jgi:hypothetical protein
MLDTLPNVVFDYRLDAAQMTPLEAPVLGNMAQRKDGLRKGGGFRLMCAWR